MNKENKGVYKVQFEKKKSKFKRFFQEHTNNISYYESPEEGFRTRIEFGVAKINNLLEFYMIENSEKVAIKHIEICNPKINSERIIKRSRNERCC